MHRNERHSQPELSAREQAKYLADTLFFSFMYSQGNEKLQEYILTDVAKRSRLSKPISEQVWTEAYQICVKQLHNFIGQYEEYDDVDENIYAAPPHHAHTINVSTSATLNKQFPVLRDSFQLNKKVPSELMSLMSNLMIAVDSRYVNYGRKHRQKISHESFIYNFAFAHTAIPGPQEYQEMFTEIRQRLTQELRKPLPSISYERAVAHDDEVVKVKKAAARKHTTLLLPIIFKMKGLKPYVLADRLGVLVNTWEKKHPGQQFFAQK